MMRVDLKTIAAVSVIGAAISVTGVAQANNSLLFPFVTTSSTAYTFVTVLENPYPEEGLPTYPDNRDIRYHVSFMGKEVNASSTEQCDFWDASGFMKQGGLAQWEAGDRFDLPSEFGDENGFEPRFFPQNRQGFMIVEYDLPGSAVGQLHGEAQIVDTATGLVMSYPALNKAGEQPDFSEDAGSEFIMSWMPLENVSTSWYVLPLGTRAEMMKMYDGIKAKVFPRGNVQNMGTYTRNSQYSSGVRSQELTCLGIFSVDDMIPSYIYDGGWTTLKTMKPDALENSIDKADAQPAQIWKATQSNSLGAPVSSMGIVEAIR